MGLIIPSFQSIEACDRHGNSGIVEENDLWLGVDYKSDNGMTEEIFDKILDDIKEIYEPRISSLGKRLDVRRNWEDGTVNAFAQQIGNTWRISMFGGLARHETITADAFALVACHELGHHVGGLPKNPGWFGGVSWASNEGQSDYYGTSKCFRRYVEDHDNIRFVEENLEVPEYATQRCMDNFEHPEDIAVCQRSAMAGMSLGNLFRALRDIEDELLFETPDENVVSRTFNGHPEPQCRVDTYFQASLCAVDHYTDVSDSDVNQGVCSRTFDFTDGVRPLCWFKPPQS